MGELNEGLNPTPTSFREWWEEEGQKQFSFVVMFNLELLKGLIELAFEAGKRACYEEGAEES